MKTIIAEITNPRWQMTATVTYTGVNYEVTTKSTAPYALPPRVLQFTSEAAALEHCMAGVFGLTLKQG